MSDFSNFIIVYLFVFLCLFCLLITSLVWLFNLCWSNFVWIVRVTSLTLTLLPAWQGIMPVSKSLEAGGEKLSRQHGVKLSPAAQVSMEEFC